VYHPQTNEPAYAGAVSALSFTLIKKEYRACSVLYPYATFLQSELCTPVNLFPAGDEVEVLSIAPAGERQREMFVWRSTIIE
jgi:hypothetical protein